MCKTEASLQQNIYFNSLEVLSSEYLLICEHKHTFLWADGARISGCKFPLAIGSLVHTTYCVLQLFILTMKICLHVAVIYLKRENIDTDSV